MIGLYIHVPFCLKKCHYCNFVVAPAGSRETRVDFLRYLEKEAAHHAPSFANAAFDTLYLGGGTPSALGAEEISRVFGIIRRNFKIKNGAEITIEVNPGDVNEANAEIYRRLGAVRASLGAQSFHDATLARINRSHGASAIGRSFHALRSAGFRNISLDLILSLPGETPDHARHSLERAMELGPEHLSLYELTIEEGTVFGRRPPPLPDESTQLQTLSFARDFLKQNGYAHYELLSYAKPGFESRHNLIYWANGEYLGLGPGAFSYVEGRRFRHSTSVEEYLAKAKIGDWSACEEEALDADRRQAESFLLALRLERGADRREFEQVERKLGDILGGLEREGLVRRTPERIKLTERGQLFAETIFTQLC